MAAVRGAADAQADGWRINDKKNPFVVYGDVDFRDIYISASYVVRCGLRGT